MRGSQVNNVANGIHRKAVKALHNSAASAVCLPECDGELTGRSLGETQFPHSDTKEEIDSKQNECCGL
jgi:hypothetical protein